MYLDFYGLKELPFKMTPDPRFLYFSPGHQEALAQMLFGINMRQGFVAITGEVGTGKTTLIHALLGQLDQKIQTAYLFYTILSAKGLFQYICKEFGIPMTGSETKDELSMNLTDYLVSLHHAGGYATLIIDEAQNLKPHILEEIRLISNIETANAKLIQILLVGQPEFSEMLDHRNMRQLKQRIALRFRLNKLTRPETEAYIRHRLEIAGYRSPDRLFAPEAVDEIYSHTDGIPRSINILCDNALVLGYSLDERRITPALVRKAEFADANQEMAVQAQAPSGEIVIQSCQPPARATKDEELTNLNNKSTGDKELAPVQPSWCQKLREKITWFNKNKVQPSIRYS